MTWNNEFEHPDYGFYAWGEYNGENTEIMVWRECDEEWIITDIDYQSDNLEEQCLLEYKRINNLMPIKKRFTLGQILSVHTGVLCHNNIHLMYKIMEFVTSDNVGVWNCTRIAKEIHPYLLDQLPFLADIKKDDVVGDDCLKKVRELERKYGVFHYVSKMPNGTHLKRAGIDDFLDLL